LAVEATHEDVVVDGSGALIPLASNPSTDLQAFRVGESGRGVQFHPELTDSALKILAESRRAVLDREGVAGGLPDGEGSRRVLASIAPAPDGRAVLKNFVTWVRAGGRTRLT
jgi:GMP synthase-like glutamine amidotransferase